MSEIKYSKETSNYGDNIFNYVAPDEITVTITLAEYRDLVDFKGKHESEMRALRMEKYNLEGELNRLKDRIAALILKYEKGEDDCK